MHVSHVDAGLDRTPAAGLPVTTSLDFLWLELTNRCNLRCVHCYTDSHPHAGDRDILTARDYDDVMRQAYDLGCRKLQFIGGEPQLNRNFHKLLVTAKTIGFDFIEVFSNLTQLDDETVCYAVQNGICFATSVYSDEAGAHDAITQVKSSHARTIRNLKRLIDRGIETRAATIVIDQDRTAVERTVQFLQELGVGRVRSSQTREFGRGEQVLSRPARLEGLCGHCWSGKLCVAPDGVAYPCVMARHWPVGNVLETPLGDIVAGRSLEAMRETIFESVWLPKIEASKSGGGKKDKSKKDKGRKDKGKKDKGKKDKGKKDKDKDTGKGKGESKQPLGDAKTKAEECFPCPQSCVPDTVPPKCPQSCVPFPATACDPGD
ncbi:MAG TPA: radical SAM/SPASM domain-containing protein [Methyloceanibacter sp.]|nr:radical SAM/SPASM domain-containing protein [Methyloceanibacter sp.]